MKKSYFILTLFLLFSGYLSQSQPISVASYIDPFIGTGGHGHTYPGASLPFGMVQLSPDSGIDGWDWCSGYHSSDSIIIGFSHTHLSGTGSSDLGDILLMPFSGNAKLHTGAGVKSRFNHKNEKASAGYYSVYLTDSKVNAELTCTKRVGIHRYTFDGNDAVSVLIDLEHGIQDSATQCYATMVSDTVVQGYRRSTGWATDHTVFFTAHFSAPIQSFDGLADQKEMESQSMKGQSVKLALHFKALPQKTLLVKVALSSVDIEGAEKNLAAEASGWKFDKFRKKAFDTWNKQLQKVEIVDRRDSLKRIFYTALYHSMLVPNTAQDVDGRYRGLDRQIHTADGFSYYTVFSLWDTYRAEHPLLSILEPAQNRDFVKTMLRMYQEGGQLPIWELAGNETWAMIGYHSIPVIADEYLKGETGFDVKMALKAMLHSANIDRPDVSAYAKLGYIPANEQSNTVSKTLEFAFDDWCIAQMAKKMGNEKVYNEFIARAQNYKKVFDPATNFMRGKTTEGTWRVPFDPTAVSSVGHGDYTEGNAWHYGFYAPQDMNTLIDLYGGRQAFGYKLDSLFQEKAVESENHLDVTGLIGQYAHGNEPCHHVAYLYNYIGLPFKTMKLVSEIRDNLYNSGRNGLCGNEDCGQMSAWYAFSALGFYPVAPASNQYIIGTPLFEKVILHLDNGKNFTIEAKDASSQNSYIQKADLNGKSWSKSYLNHSDLINGGTLSFKMGNSPSKWATAKDDCPVSRIADTSLK